MDKDKLVEIKDSITEDITLGNLKDIARQVKMPGFSKYKSDTKNELVKLLKKFIKNLIKQKTPPSPKSSPSPKPKKGKTSKEKPKTPSKKDVEPAKESEYKKRDLIKKSIEELKQILKSQKIKQGYSQSDDKTKLIGDFFLSQRCDPEKGKWCPDDQLCDIRNIKGGGPGICRTPELLDEYEGLIQQTVGTHTFVGSQKAIDELNIKLAEKSAEEESMEESAEESAEEPVEESAEKTSEEEPVEESVEESVEEPDKEEIEEPQYKKYKKRDLVKKSIEELKQILKENKIKQGYSEVEDKTKLINDFFLSTICNPEKGRWCPDDQLCDIRNIKRGGPGICRTPELLDEYEGLIQQTVGKHTFVGSQTAIDELNTKLESIKSKDISKKLGELSKKAIKAAQKQAEEDEKASKKQVEEEAKAAKKQAEVAKKQAEEEAKVAKKQAEEEAKAAKKQSKKQADLKNTLEKMDFIELVEVANELGFNETADGTDISNMEPDQLIDEILYFSLYKEQKPSEEKSSVKTKKDISGLLKTLKKNKDVGEIADIGDVQKEILKCLGLL